MKMSHEWMLLAVLTGLAPPPLAHAADFAPKGARALLVTDFVYESSGRKADRVDSHEWRVSRTLHIEAQLTADAPTSWGSAGPDAAQAAKVEKLQAQSAKLATQMAPTMEALQAIVARCGEDEKCVERETAKLGFGMSGTAQLAATQKTGREAAEAARPGDPRVQRWVGAAQKGSYAIDEKTHIVHADPICMKLPGARCTRDETRKGSGALASSNGSLASIEVDIVKNTVLVQLPMPLDALPYTETIVTDEPEGTHETPTPKGPRPGQLIFRQTADGQPGAKPFTVPLKGGWRNQSGEQTVKINGQAGEGGTLTVRWRFSAS